MLLDEGMDTGPVIAQREYALDGRETAGELTDTLFAMGADLLADSLTPWTRGDVQASPQDDSAATISRKLERADGLADWTLPAERLARQCRAYAPWPGLYTQWQGKTLKVVEAEALPDEMPVAREAGRVTLSESGKISVGTGQGMLALNRVQLEGRRAVTGEEFLRGYPEIAGEMLGSQLTKK